MQLSEFEQHLLNDFQHQFPLCREPYHELAADLNCDVKAVLQGLRSLKERGVVSRVGAVFRPNSIGASTLAAIAVPPDRLHEIAQIVNLFEEVNHNYEREHRFNLWFVLTADSQPRLEKVLEEISRATGFKVMSLPLLQDFHIDLGFNLNFSDVESSSKKKSVITSDYIGSKAKRLEISAQEEVVIAAIQSGFPLLERPFDEVSESIGLLPEELIAVIEGLKKSGAIKRMGVIVRHHELGYRSNAMVVWDVPDVQLQNLGKQLAMQDCVTLCYQRPRRLPEWKYNLFCMIHGKDRHQVLSYVENIVDMLGFQCDKKNSNQNKRYEVLFSKTRFKQRGARYRKLLPSIAIDAQCERKSHYA